MTTPVRRVHRPGKYIPKARELPAPPPRVFEDFEDDVTEHMARIVPVAAPSVVLPPARRTPVRLRKEVPVPVVDIAPAPPKGEAPWYGVLDNIEERIDENGFSYFIGAYNEVQEQATVDAREMLDPNDVPLEAKEAIAELEGELGDEIAALAASTAKTRVTIAEKGMRSLEGVLYFVKNGVPELAETGFELMNLNTKEKVYAALLEIIPTVSFWYAATGKRLKFKEGAGWSQPEFEDIDTIDRLMYLAGSVVFVGHVYSGIRHALASKGVFALARQGRIFAAARALIPEAAKLVGPTVARAQQYGIRELTKDRSKGIMDEKL